MISDSNQKKHIAIVDDEPVNLELAENALAENYKVTKLISGKQLFKFLSRVKPDLILLDVQMPDMNGYEVIAEIMRNPETQKIPVIFLTSQYDINSEKKGFYLGAIDFIKKPFEREIMLARINSQIELCAYRTALEEVIEEKATQIVELQHLLTIGFAEMIESRDGTTGSHVRNTTAYFEILIRAMMKCPEYEEELTEEVVSELFRASTFHDVGKIGISDLILKKPASLNSEEYEEMKKHSQLGADMLGKLSSLTHFENFLKYAKEMAWFHHERWDGTGYPKALKGTEIPVYVRALSLVDVYDALTSVRPYKGAFSHAEALEIMSSDCGKFFDPRIFEIFMQNEEAICKLMLVSKEA